jgi:ABC-2 type transport system ATP-binding protein
VLLAARGIARSYGRTEALSPTDVEVRAGEIVAVVGPNGAGKSTLLALLAGTLPPTQGAILRGTPPPRVGWAPQQPAQYAHLSPRENLELFARLADLDEPRAAVERMLETMGLPGGRGRVGHLSVGNQQRLNIALALLGEPRVLLLDEPTASLDPERRRALWTLLEELRDAGGAVLLSSHSPREVAHLASRVLVLLDGRVVFEGRPAELEQAMPDLAGGV